MTLNMLLEKYTSARTDIAHSTKVGESGRIDKFRELLPPPDGHASFPHCDQPGRGKRAKSSRYGPGDQPSMMSKLSPGLRECSHFRVGSKFT